MYMLAQLAEEPGSQLQLFLSFCVFSWQGSGFLEFKAYVCGVLRVSACRVSVCVCVCVATEIVINPDN